MKIFITVLLLTFSMASHAGSYRNTNTTIDDYDPVTGLYYKSIVIKTKNKNFLSSGSKARTQNINIFNPETGVSSLLFKDDVPRNIFLILYESSFKEGSIIFKGSRYSFHIKNNSAVIERALKTKLLIGINNKVTNITTLWTADKTGKNLAKLLSIPFNQAWHIDVKNSKLRVVKVINGKINIESYEW